MALQLSILVPAPSSLVGAPSIHPPCRQRPPAPPILLTMVESLELKISFKGRKEGGKEGERKDREAQKRKEGNRRGEGD